MNIGGLDLLKSFTFPGEQEVKDLTGNQMVNTQLINVQIIQVYVNFNYIFLYYFKF